MLLSKFKNINSKHLIAFAALCFYIYNFSLGLELTPDSFSYLSGAKNILQGHGYVGDYNQRAISIFPPFYSFYLIPFLKFGGFSSNGIIISSIVLFLSSIFLLVYFQKLSLVSWEGVIIFFVTVSFLFSTHISLLSETLFIPLFILWYAMSELYKKKTNRVYTIILTLEILLISTRYSAFLIIASFYFIELFFDFKKSNEQKIEKINLIKYLIPIISFSYLILLQGLISDWQFPHIFNIVNRIDTGYSLLDYVSQVALDIGDNIYGKTLSFQLEKFGLLLTLTIIFSFFFFYSFHVRIEKRVIFFIVLLLVVHILVFSNGGAGDPIRGRFLFWIYIILLFNLRLTVKKQGWVTNFILYFLLVSHLMNDFYFLINRFNTTRNFIYAGILLPSIYVNSKPVDTSVEISPGFLNLEGKKVLVYPCYKWQL